MSERPPIGKRAAASQRQESQRPASASPTGSTPALDSPTNSFSSTEAVTRTAPLTLHSSVTREQLQPNPQQTPMGDAEGTARAAREALNRSLRRTNPGTREYASIEMVVRDRTSAAQTSSHKSAAQTSIGSQTPSRALSGLLTPSRAPAEPSAPLPDAPPATVRRPSTSISAMRGELPTRKVSERPPATRGLTDDAAARASALNISVGNPPIRARARVLTNNPERQAPARTSASNPTMRLAPATSVAQSANLPSFGAATNTSGAAAASIGKQSESSAREVRVKGINFTTALDAIQLLYGPNARSRIEKESPGEIGDALRFGGIVAGGWYSIAWYREFWRSLHDILGIDESGARRIGHRAAKIGVNVAYRALARMTSPSMLLSMSARAFGYYYEPATLAVKQPEPKRLTAEWRDCNGFDNFIWNEVAGGAIYFIEATGVAGVNFSVIAGGGNANFMLATATWR